MHTFHCHFFLCVSPGIFTLIQQEIQRDDRGQRGWMTWEPVKLQLLYTVSVLNPRDHQDAPDAFLFFSNIR